MEHSGIDGQHYGIDFIMNWESVLAAADGNVEIAGWFNSSCHDEQQPGCGTTSAAGFGLHVRINHGPTDHPYRTYYGHLSVARTGVATYSQGQWLGTSGDSGYSTAPHLHFEIRHAGTAQANAVNPDNEGGSTLWTSGEWAGNSPTTPAGRRKFVTLGTYGSEIIVDDTSDNTNGFTASCTTSPNCSGWNRVTTAGYSSDMYWVNDNNATATYWAEWRPSLPQAANYRVLAYIPCTYAESWQAPYSISDGNNVTSVIVDQLTLCNQWIELGVAFLPAGTSSYLRITNATQETPATRKVGVDAVKFVRVNIGGFETENYRKAVDRGGHSWDLSTSVSGYSGSGYMIALPNSGTATDVSIESNSPDMKFNLVFPTAGRYYVWIRGRGNSNTDDSVHAGVENLVISTSYQMSCAEWQQAIWAWCKNRMNSSSAYIDINPPGFYTFNLYMRDDGFRADKILLTADGSYNPVTTPTTEEEYIFPGDDMSVEP